MYLYLYIYITLPSTLPCNTRAFLYNIIYILLWVVGFFQCWTAPCCFLNSWVVCHSKKGLKSISLLQREDQSLIPATWLVCPFQNTWKQRQCAVCELILPTLGLCLLFLFTYHISMMRAQHFIYKAIQSPFFKRCILIDVSIRPAEPRQPYWCQMQE